MVDLTRRPNKNSEEEGGLRRVSESSLSLCRSAEPNRNRPPLGGQFPSPRPGARDGRGFPGAREVSAGGE